MKKTLPDYINKFLFDISPFRNNTFCKIYCFLFGHDSYNLTYGDIRSHYKCRRCKIDL